MNIGFRNELQKSTYRKAGGMLASTVTSSRLMTVTFLLRTWLLNSIVPMRRLSAICPSVTRMKAALRYGARSGPSCPEVVFVGCIIVLEWTCNHPGLANVLASEADSDCVCQDVVGSESDCGV